MSTSNKFEDCIMYQVITPDAYKYPLEIVNKLRYKKDNNISNEYFCELIKYNWLPLELTPRATFSKKGNTIIPIRDTDVTPINFNNILIVIENNGGLVKCRGDIIINAEEYLIFKGY